MKNPIERGHLGKRELSSREQEILKSFEIIPFVQLIDKARLILVWRKLKSATTFSLKPPITDLELENTRKSIENTGLFFGYLEMIKKGVPRHMCTVANSKSNLDMAMKLIIDEHPNYGDLHLKLGRLYGFPETAIEAFILDHDPVTDKKITGSKFSLRIDESEEKTPENLKPFSSFMLSRANWKKELETLKKWAEEIKLIDPALYLEMLNQK